MLRNIEKIIKRKFANANLKLELGWILMLCWTEGLLGSPGVQCQRDWIEGEVQSSILRHHWHKWRSAVSQSTQLAERTDRASHHRYSKGEKNHVIEIDNQNGEMVYMEERKDISDILIFLLVLVHCGKCCKLISTLRTVYCPILVCNKLSELNSSVPLHSHGILLSLKHIFNTPISSWWCS